MINKHMCKDIRNSQISEQELYESYKIFFGTLVSEPRLRIINFLRDGKKNVSEIMKELKMDQTSVSHNLSRLKRCGFLNQSIEGKFRYYELNEKTIMPIMDMIDKHMSKNCIHILHSMRSLKGVNENEER